MGKDLSRNRRRRLALLVLVVAPVLHILSFWLALDRVEPFYSCFYSLAWWSYIPFVAACNHLAGQNSLLFDEPREFRKLAILSVPLWSFFELCNFQLENWFYVGVPSEWWVRFPGYFAAFGSVLPGLFETRILIANIGLGGRTCFESSGVPPTLRGWLAGLGICMSISALVWPAVFFPLIWVGPIFCLDWMLFQSRRPDESLFGIHATGEGSPLAQLLISGFVCGFLWEFWNFWAGSKWIYSLPYLNSPQVFEMPVAGFLGFPPFAVECWLGYRLVRLSGIWSVESLFSRVLLAVLYLIFCASVFRGIESWTVLNTRALWG